MKKFIVKTAVITLITIFAVFVILITAMTVCAPRTMSDMFYDLGSESLSAWYMELSYQKTDSPEDLEKLIFRSSEAKDFKRLQKYCEKLSEREDFDEICNKNGEYYKNYVYGKYVKALCENGAEYDKIFAVADKTVTGGYADDNAYHGLIMSEACGEDLQFLTALNNKLGEMDFDSELFMQDKTTLSEVIDRLQKGENI